MEEEKINNSKQDKKIIKSIIGIVLTIIIAILSLICGYIYSSKQNKQIIIKMSELRKECAFASECDMAPIVNKKTSSTKVNVSKLMYEINKLTYNYENISIIIEDDVKPLVSYDGNKLIDINTEFNKEDITITDYGFDNIPIDSQSVTINMGGFDSEKEAIYTITVTALDKAGNKTIENFKIEVLDQYITLNEYKNILNNGKLYKNSVLTDMPAINNFSINEKNIISFDVENITYQIDFTISTIKAGDFLYRLYPGTLNLGAIDYNGYRFEDETTLNTGKPMIEDINKFVKVHTGLNIEDFMGASDPGNYIINRITMEATKPNQED